MAKTKAVQNILPPVVRTSAGLRDALFDELDRMRSGETSAANANAVARLADQVVNTVRMELDVHKHMTKIPEGKLSVEMPKPLALSAN